ncbi:MAG: 50S ribosomal protein L25 [Bacillota bacterium]
MELKLTAQLREKNEKLSQDDLAAILYGRGLESRSIKVNRNVFGKLFAEAGESNLITLDLDGKEFPVLVKAVQRDALKNNLIHIDFYQVNMKEKVKAEIPLEFIGDSKAVKEYSGVFVVNMDEVSVECLPGDLVDHIDVDISLMNELGDMIRLQDLKLPKGISLEHEGNEVICVVEEPKKVEEEPVAAPAEASAAPAAEQKPAEQK